MRAAIVAIVVVGCYRPHPQAGAPCAANGDCPSELQCIAGACRAPGTIVDAALDADLACAIDSDGDGIVDCHDNCPTVPNPGQENEDGDRFGDVCDPCPPIADADPVLDGDGDGVSDACDPRPTIPGDRIALFEGFHHGVPSTWIATGAGTWQAGTNDDIVGANTTANDGFLTVPGPNTKHETVSALVHLISVDPTISCTAGSKFGIVDDFDPTMATGVGCEYQSGTLALVQVGMAVINSASFTAMQGDNDLFALRRDLTGFVCVGKTLPGGRNITAAGSSSTDQTAPQVGPRLCGASMAVAWLMVVSN